MMSRYKEIDLRKVRTISINDRKSTVDITMLGKPFDPGSSFGSFLNTLPSILAAKELKNLVKDIVSAYNNKRPVLVMMGAHVIKVGLSPVIIDLMNLGLISGVALNGAGAIHDVELTYFGKTSEDVKESLKNGMFGMARETAEIMNNISKSSKDPCGLGEVLGMQIIKDRPKNIHVSILAHGYEKRIPVTVHVALGTDIVHQHSSADGATIGDMSLRDFRIWANLLTSIGNGGVVLLFGSSVVLPEVFLKALSVARNIKGEIKNFITANFDMIQHYRPTANVIKRPTSDGGKGYTIIGHHELMIPLLAAYTKELLNHSKK